MKIKYKSGNTPLLRIPTLCKKFNLPNLWIKDESKNPFGTFKDRRNELIIKSAIDEHVDKLALITGGNAGYGLARFSEGTDIKVVNIVDKKCKNSVKNSLKKYSYRVIETDLSKKILKPEEVIALARETDEETIWDVTNGYHRANEKIVSELKREHPSHIDYIVVPLGGGELFVGVYSGLKKLKMKAKLVGVGVKSPHSIADKLSTPWTPYSSKIKSILKSEHKYIKLDENEIKLMMRVVDKSINSESSAVVVFGALSKLKLNKDDEIILVNTGMGLF